MTLRLFPLIAYPASSAYLVCWMIHLSWAIYQRVRSWAHPPRMMLSLKSWSKIGEENGIYVYFIGILFGGLATLWLMHIFIWEWLLVIFVVLAVLSDEMQVSSTETLLLEVMIIFDRLGNHIQDKQDLFESLTNVVQELPEGRIQKSVLEAVLHRRSGASFENSLKAMRGIDPLLDEFVLTLQHSGWKYGPGLNIILNRLTGRAGRKWDRVSWRHLIKDKCRAYVQFSRGAFITALWVILIRSSSSLNLVMPDRAVIVLVVVALLGVGFMFCLFLKSHWLRWSIAISIFIVALASYANSLIVSIPSWIRVESVSHHSESVRDISIIAPQISTGQEEVIVPFQLPAALSDPPIAATTHPTSTPTPTAVATMILNRPVLISNPVIPQDFNLCCLRSHQPR